MSPSPEPSTANEFFEHVRHLSGHDPEAAARASSRWREFAAEDRATALRARAVGERCRGLWAKSAATLAESARHAASPRQAAMLQIGRIDSLARAGKPDAAVRLGRALVRNLDSMAEPQEAARARLNTANALLWEDRYAAARPLLRQAVPHLTGVERAAAVLALSTAELYGGSPAAALELAQVAQQDLQSLGMGHFVLLARLNGGYARALLGEVEAAISELQECRARLGPGGAGGRASELLADVYLACGLLGEAKSEYEVARRAATGLNRANIVFGLGRVAERDGDLQGAAQHYSRAAAAYRRLGNEVWETWARARSVFAAHQSAPGVRPAARLARLAERLRRMGARRFAALADLDAAELGGPSRYVRARLVQAGAGSEAWRLTRLASRGKGGAEAARLLCTALEELEQARDRLASPALRAAHMRGKEGLVGEAAEAALGAFGPDAALRVVRAHRALGLMEEAGGLLADSARAEAVRELRSALAQNEQAELGRLQTAWTEAHLGMRTAAAQTVEQSGPPALTLVERHRSVLALTPHSAERLAVSAAERESLLRRLHYELAGARTDGPAGVHAALRALDGLRALLPDGPPPPSINAEGSLWQVPWPALMGAETLLALAPVAAAAPAPLPAHPSVCVWAPPSADLPNVERELAGLLARFPAARVCRSLDEAREHLLRGQSDLLHVVAHAGAHPSNTLFSWIGFPEGKLYAFEILGSRARFGAVVLSACEGAAVGGASVLEPEGLGRAFLARSAQVVVGSLWPLDDDAARVFVDCLYSGLTAGTDWVSSVASARLEVRNSMPHPYFWAPFVTLGGYSR